MWLVAPTEPAELQSIGEAMPPAMEQARGADYLLAVGGKTFGVQRKEFPGDFLSSLQKGSLGAQIRLLAASVTFPLLVLEGVPEWGSTGALLGAWKDWDTKRHNALIFSLTLAFGLRVFWTEDIWGTKELLEALERWTAKERHSSLMVRPKVKDNWNQSTEQTLALGLLQGFPGMGAENARKVLDTLGMPLKWSCSAQDLMTVPGVGAGLAEKWLRFLGQEFPEELKKRTRGRAKTQ